MPQQERLLLSQLLHRLSNRPESNLAKRTKALFSAFVKEFWECVPGAGEVVWNWHMDVICDSLQESAERVFANLPALHDLLYNICFGTSKSTLCSILFPVWTWTRMPQARHILATHTQSLVYDFIFKIREVVKSEKFQEHFPSILTTRDSGDCFSNTAGGEIRSCTVGGKTPMGKHCHFFGIDDPIDPLGARSMVILETAAHFMRQVAPSRVVDKQVSVIRLVMQRIDYRDPTAVMLADAMKADARVVKHYCIPGELTDDVKPEELRTKYINGLMDERRLPWSVLKNYQAKLGPDGYAGQVLQKPYPPGGGRFKDYYFNRREKSSPYNSQRILYIDRAATSGSGCATAMTLMAKDSQGLFWVEHCVQGHWEPIERNQKIIAEAHRCRSRYGPNHQPVIHVEAERGSTGLEAYQGLAKLLLEQGFTVFEDIPSGSKDTRSEPWSAACAAGLTRLVEDGTWDVEGYVQEHVVFRPMPGKRIGGLVDRVDSSSGAYNLLANTKTIAPMRTFHYGAANKLKHLMVLVCKLSDLPTAIIELNSLLVVIRDPQPKENNDGGMHARVGFNGSVSGVRGDEGVIGGRGRGDGLGGMHGGELNNGGGQYPIIDTDLPHHSMSKLQDSLTLRFADLVPEDMQNEWETILPDYNLKPSEVIITQEQGKKLWSFLLKKRQPNIECLVFTSPNSRRAISVAKVVAQQFRLPDPTIMNVEIEPAPNPHIMEMVKRTRNMVIA